MPAKMPSPVTSTSSLLRLRMAIDRKKVSIPFFHCPTIRLILSWIGKIFSCGCGVLTAQIIISLSEQIHWPAYNTSYVLLGVTTTLGWLLWLSLWAVPYLYPHIPWLAQSSMHKFMHKFMHKSQDIITIIGLTATVTTILAMPLAATSLYLGGISIDQQFRTEFVTRLTDSAQLSDMTYAHLPSFYPSGWFWLAGRYAALMHIPGWAAVKPFSIITISTASSIAYLWWRKLFTPQQQTHTITATPITYESEHTICSCHYRHRGSSSQALLLALLPTLIVLPYAQEAYSTALAIVFPPACITVWRVMSARNDRALTRYIPTGNIVASGIFLGITITTYTLYSGVFMWLMLFFGCALLLQNYPLRTICLAIAYIWLIGIVLGATVWIPFICRAIHDLSAVFAPGGATAYLPAIGAMLSTPFMEISIPGFLCLIGVFWLIKKFTSTTDAFIWGLSLISLYSWQLLSCLVTTIGTTLLGFRLAPIIAAICVCAGVRAIPEFIRHGKLTTTYFTSPRITAAVVCLAIACWVQGIPRSMSTDITRAYTDTNGYGYRADRRQPGPERYYTQLSQAIHTATTLPANKIIIATSDYGFLAITAFRGFQSLTPHYANPLAHFATRNQLLIQWSHSTTCTELLTALTSPTLTVAPPDVWIFRLDADNNYYLRLSENVFPNNPNVHRFPISFTPKVFACPQWQQQKIGPFILVISQRLIRSHSR